jgi:hypothetical protein
LQALADLSHQAGIGCLQCFEARPVGRKLRVLLLELRQEVGHERRPGTRGQKTGLPFSRVVLGRLLAFKTDHAPPVTPWFCTIFIQEERF